MYFSVHICHYCTFLTTYEREEFQYSFCCHIYCFLVLLYVWHLPIAFQKDGCVRATRVNAYKHQDNSFRLMMNLVRAAVKKLSILDRYHHHPTYKNTYFFFLCRPTQFPVTFISLPSTTHTYPQNYLPYLSLTFFSLSSRSRLTAALGFEIAGKQNRIFYHLFYSTSRWWWGVAK